MLILFSSDQYHVNNIVWHHLGSAFVIYVLMFKFHCSLFNFTTGESIPSILTLLTSLLAMCGASGCFGIMYFYTPEMFPTNLRQVQMTASWIKIHTTNLKKNPHKV